MTSEVGLRVAGLLYQTFSSVSESERRAAEEQLKALALDVGVYTQTLLTLISSTHPDISSKIKSSAAVQLRQTIRSAVDSGSLPLDRRAQLALLVFQVLTNMPMESTVRGSLGYCLNPLLNTDNQDPQGDTCKTLQPLIFEALSGSSLQMQGSLRTLKSLYAGIANSQSGNLVEFYRLINPKLTNIARQGLAHLTAGLQNSQSDVIQEVLAVLEEWAFAFNTILEYFELSSSKSLKDVCQDFQLAEIFSQVLLFRFPDTGSQSSTLICTDSNTTSVAFSNIKIQVLQGLNLLLQYLIDHKKKSVEESGSSLKVMTLIGVSMPPSPFVTVTIQLLEPFIMTLLSICARQDVDELMQMEFVSELVIELLLLLYKCISETVFYQTFAVCYKQLAINICLLFIRCSENELESMTSTPEEFASLALDTCERQESQTPKTTSAQLLESLCTCVDGALSFTVNFLAQLIDFTITGSNYANLSNYPALVEMQGQTKLLMNSEELRIETSLMALCVLAYAVQKRTDLSGMVEQVLTSHLAALTSVNSGLVKARLCLFLNYYFESMFQGEASTQVCLQFLLNSLNPSQEHPAVHIQACNTLAAFVQDEEVMIRVESCLPLILNKMVEVLPQQREKTFFDTLQELVMSDPAVVIQNLLPLLTGLVLKIKQEQLEISSAEKPKAKKKESILIVKCWNIIRTITDSRHVIPQYQSLAEEVLAPLFEYISVPLTVEFEDDIILVWISFIKKSQNVTPRGWMIFERLPGVQQKYQGDFGQLFQVLNAYITYGQGVIGSNPQYISLIMEMGFGCLFSAPNGKVSEPSCSEGALILQEMILSFPGRLDQWIAPILDKVLERYGQGVKNQFFKVRLLDTFLAAINYNVNLTVGLLTGRNQLKQLCVEVLTNVDNFTHSYDKKLAVLSLLQLVILDPKPPELAEMTYVLFDAVIGIMLAKKEAPVAQPAKPANSRLEDLLTDDDEKDDEDLPPSTYQPGMSESRGEEAEANLTLNSMVSPLKDFDETEHFRKLISSLSSSMLQSLIQPMSEPRKGELRDLLQSRRVQISGLAGDNTVVRKVLKAKRRLRK